jgi:protoporphyrinogen/coproporphyrinogen III oxidase
MGVDRQTVVIGGGITGLACAFRLQQLGVSIMLLEASERAGGVIATTRRNGFLFEASTQCPRFPRALWELVRELGLEKEFVRADPHAKRYIVKGGSLHPAPFSPWALLTTRLVGLGSKARLLTEPFHRSQPPQSEESLADFVRRKFDGDVLDYLVDPFVSAVFFADPNEMGMESALPALARWEREYGSVLRGAIKSRNVGARRAPFAKPAASSASHSAARVRVTDFLPPLGSFKLGLATLTDKLAEKLGDSLRLRARVEKVCPAAAGSEARWGIRLCQGEDIETEAIVVAAPAYEAAAFVRSTAPQLSSLLAGIPYSPLAVVSSAYDRAQVRHPLDGFGFNIPRCEGLHTISCTWNSSLFAERAPEGKVLITSFARPLANDAFLEMAPEEIARVVEGEVARILGISGSPVDRMVWKYPRALPQYRVGHAQRVAAIREELRGLPGLHLVGNYFHGRSLGDSVEIAFGAAEDVCRDLGAGAVKASQSSRA